MYNEVWIIDDSEIDHMVAERVLKYSQFATQTLSFHSAEKAMNQLQVRSAANARIPEMIFLDIHMPGMNGMEFLAKWRELPSQVQSGCRIVVLSSISNEQRAEQLTEFKFVVTVLHKPLREEMLSGLLKP